MQDRLPDRPQAIDVTKNLKEAIRRTKQARGFLFDMNNTLLFIDEVDFYTHYRPLKERFNIEITYKDYLKYAGSKRRAIFKKLYRDATQNDLSDEDLKWLLRRARQLKTLILSKADVSEILRLASGVVEFLTWAKSAGKRMGVVTSTTSRYAPKLIKSAKIADFFDFIVAADDVVHGKPHPEPFLAGLQLLGLPAAEVVAFEDSGPGIASAKAAGLFVIALLSRGINEDKVQAADAVITDYRQLLEG